ncbi:AraC family ligand binding domain-containing protein [Lysinibacillus sp. FSL H8-0500]|uniref:AraC family ligand binding domain-containing protein n=1 Tax=Lysinibacillus sp. FSL H8-0500 TaxID=2921393 RepID=UPI003101B465
MTIIQVQAMLEEKAKFIGKLGSIDGADILNIQLRAGEKIPEHHTDNEVLIIVQFGEVRFVIEGVEKLLTPDTILALKPLEDHSLEAITDVCIVVIKLT